MGKVKEKTKNTMKTGKTNIIEKHFVTKQKDIYQRNTSENVWHTVGTENEESSTQNRQIKHIRTVLCKQDKTQTSRLALSN